jgi:hypothetical protein
VKDILRRSRPRVRDLARNNDWRRPVDEPFSNKARTPRSSSSLPSPRSRRSATSRLDLTHLRGQPPERDEPHRRHRQRLRHPGVPVGVPLDKTPARSTPSKILWFDVAVRSQHAYCGLAATYLRIPPSGAPPATPRRRPARDSPGSRARTGWASPPPPSPSVSRQPREQRLSDPLTAGDQGRRGAHRLTSFPASAATGRRARQPGTERQDLRYHGNLREFTKVSNGLFNPARRRLRLRKADETGSSCDFTFSHTVDTAPSAPFDTGFRCFSADRTPGCRWVSPHSSSVPIDFICLRVALLRRQGKLRRQREAPA